MKTSFLDIPSFQILNQTDEILAALPTAPHTHLTAAMWQSMWTMLKCDTVL